MSLHNEEKNTLNENKENKSDNENNLNRLDSPNNADNETNKILEKENNDFDPDEPKNKKEIKQSNFFHDKDITEDSIIYFSNKLKQSNNSYKIFLYISIITYILDIIIWNISSHILHNYFNLFSIIIILISVLYQAYSFRHNFETISKALYNFIQIIIYEYICATGLFLVGFLYITYSQIFNKDKIFLRNENIIDYPSVVFIYEGVNVFISIMVSFKLISVKKCIKNLSAAKGEVYETPKIEDVQIYNSVINAN